MILIKTIELIGQPLEKHKDINKSTFWYTSDGKLLRRQKDQKG